MASSHIGTSIPLVDAKDYFQRFGGVPQVWIPARWRSSPPMDLDPVKAVAGGADDRV